MFADYWTKLSPVNIADDWERLSFMQHHGVPTRLLDWTENLNAALFFAVAYSSRKGTGDPYIWVLNPYRLNKLYKGASVIYDAIDKIDYDYYTAAKAKSFPHALPIAMRPTWSNDRISAQSGAFTVHGQDERPLEELVDKQIAKRVKIDHSEVGSIREKLRNEQVHHYALFRDAVGLARHVTDERMG